MTDGTIPGVDCSPLIQIAVLLVEKNHMVARVHLLRAAPHFLWLKVDLGTTPLSGYHSADITESPASCGPLSCPLGQGCRVTEDGTSSRLCAEPKWRCQRLVRASHRRFQVENEDYTDYYVRDHRSESVGS